MERKNSFLHKIPDAIYRGPKNDFTQIPNSLLRDPKVSAKAKMVLCLLLSNKEGWKTCIPSLLQMVKEGEHVLSSALLELEKNEYLLRIRYRCKKTKQLKGSFWVYTDTKGCFCFEDHSTLAHQLELNGCELVLMPQKKGGPAQTGFSRTGFSLMGESSTNNIKDKKIKVEPKGSTSFEEDKKITFSMFENFWKLYPKKTDKGKALTKWKTICNKPPNEKPTWKQIKKAIILQNKTERWQTGFIPLPTTWLNQSRWLDDPAEMKSFPPKGTKGIGAKTLPDSYYREPDITM